MTKLIINSTEYNNTRKLKVIYNVRVFLVLEYLICIKEELKRLNINPILNKTHNELTNDEVNKLIKYTELKDKINLLHKYINCELLDNSEETNKVNDMLNYSIEEYISKLLSKEELLFANEVYKSYENFSKEELIKFLNDKYSKENFKNLNISELYVLSKLFDKLKQISFTEFKEDYEDRRINNAHVLSKAKQNISVYN